MDEVYASSDLSVVMPKYKMPEKEHDPRHAYQVVHDELMLDGNARQNLATFCQTWLDEYVHKLMDECIDKNMIDKDEYPQTAEIEACCVQILADLWNSPESANTLGTSTTGSSDAAMLGGMAMKWRWREKMKAAGKPVGINKFIGRRPIAAFGNSAGDRQMLEWTGAGSGQLMMMLVFHDDAEREYAYGPANGLPDTKFGTFPQSLMDEAEKKGWVVISMKNDWKRIFAFEK